MNSTAGQIRTSAGLFRNFSKLINDFSYGDDKIFAYSKYHERSEVQIRCMATSAMGRKVGVAVGFPELDMWIFAYSYNQAKKIREELLNLEF